MSAYLIVDLEITDSAAWADYRDGVFAVVAKHRGEYLVRGGDTRVLEGDWTPQRLLWFDSPTVSPWTLFGMTRNTSL
jgi:uncharacterized protein (DUF1330 family)